MAWRGPVDDALAQAALIVQATLTSRSRTQTGRKHSAGFLAALP